VPKAGKGNENTADHHAIRIILGLTFAPPPDNHGRTMGVGETTDQLRTTTAELSAPQRSTMDTS
jgi:hypothetical protein